MPELTRFFTRVTVDDEHGETLANLAITFDRRENALSLFDDTVFHLSNNYRSLRAARAETKPA